MSDIDHVMHVRHNAVGENKAMVDVIYACGHPGRVPYNPKRVKSTRAIVRSARHAVCPGCARHPGRRKGCAL